MVGMKNILLPDRYVNQVVPTNGFTTLLTFFTSATIGQVNETQICQ